MITISILQFKPNVYKTSIILIGIIKAIAEVQNAMKCE